MTPEIPDSQRPASIAPTERQLEQETPGGIAAAGHDPYGALRLPAYRRYTVGTTLSFVGSQMQSAAVGWEIALRSARPALALSLVGLVGAAPVILLALPAGHLADTWDRKKLTIGTILLAALCSLGLAALSFTNGPLIFMYLLLLLSATMSAIGGPARSVPDYAGGAYRVV